MSADLGSLVVSLEANTVKFEEALNRAEHLAKTQAEAIADHFDEIKKAAEHLAEAYLSVEGVMKFAEIIAGSVEAAAQMQVMSEKAGVSAAAFSNLKAIAALTETPIESVSTGLQKLSKTMEAAAAGSQKQSDLFKSMGVAVTDSDGKLRSSADVMQDVAVKLSSMENKTQAVALAQQIFGKAGANLIPMMNDMAVSGHNVAAITNEMAENADTYEKNLVRLGQQKQALVNTITNAFLPTMIDVEDALLKSDGLVNQLNGSAKKLDEEGALQDWARKSALFIAALIDEGRIVADVMIVLSSSALQVVAAASMLAEGAANLVNPWGKVSDAVDHYKQNIASLKQAQESAFAGLAEPIRTYQALLDEFSKRDAGLKTPKEKTAAGSVDIVDQSGKTQQYDALVKSIQSKIEIDQQELAGQQKLTAAEQFAIQTRNMMAESSSKLTASEKAHIEALLQTYVALDKQWQSQQQATAAQDAYLKIANEITTQATNHNEQLAFEASLVGKNAEQVKILTAQYQIQGQESAKLLAIQNDKAFKERDTNAEVMKSYQAAIDMVVAVGEHSKEQAAVEIDAREKVARSWDTGMTSAINTYLDNVSNAAAQSNRLFSNAFKGMEDAMVSFVKTGKLDFTSLADSIITDLIRIQVQNSITKPLAAAMSGGGGLSGMFSSLFNANGNIFGAQGFANGGAFTNSVVDSPTSFAFANGGGFSQGVMGEAGPEAVMPLTRGPDGKLGVAASGGGGGVVVNTSFSPVINAAPGTDVPGILSVLQQFMPAMIVKNKEAVVAAVNSAMMSRGQSPIRM